MSNGISELSQKQLEVLRLVAARKSSKEIARALGISKHTVDQRIASARQKLGLASRNELALLYLANDQIYDSVVYDPAQLSSDDRPIAYQAQVERQGPIFQVSDIAGFVPAFAVPELGPYPQPLEMLDNQWGIVGRLAVVLGLAVMMALALLAVIALSKTLSDLL